MVNDVTEYTVCNIVCNNHTLCPLKLLKMYLCAFSVKICPFLLFLYTFSIVCTHPLSGERGGEPPTKFRGG